ncbi:MAG TPA: SDR family oxidoreductase, partial [Candidatus Competibacteraceae bacterium]|nr:SDR family oxidoreductase [Candidatus Competibacteraceae bacterium]
MNRVMAANDPFTLFVLNPAGLNDPALAIAGCRTGAVGVFNAEVGVNPSELATALKRLATLHTPFGLKWGGSETPTALDADRLVRPAWLILDAERNIHLLPTVQAFRASGGRVLLELSFWRDAFTDLESQIDGWWVKGHEAGGAVGEESSFVLLQRLLERTLSPVYVRGGIGLHTAAACQIGGAAGVVLEHALLLLRESPVADALRPWLRGLDGTETVLLGHEETGRYVRVLERPGFAPVTTLRQRLQDDRENSPATILDGLTGWRDPRAHDILPLGQEIAFAASWAERYGTVASVIRAIRRALAKQSHQAQKDAALAENSLLARVHATRFPIVQGAMTRVSDCAEFAKAVAAAGALPMIALAMLKGDRSRELLAETARCLNGQSWGVGILGFVPAALREEQLAAIRAVRPPFAYIAGGRPEQARQLEADGIPTYLHVPTPTLLRLFLEQGARRFIFEGRECGGHIGPLSSFVLWESMIEALLAWGDEHVDGLTGVAVLFAGGIHDARSAAMAATLAAPLTQRGACIGILMGTAYILTEEAVRCGAIQPDFQQVALDCATTATLTTGPGHASRCAITPFVATFHQTRRQLQAQGEPARTVRDRLDDLTLGRLRVATKGLLRSEPTGELRRIDPDEQRTQGMYMIGQVAALHDRPLTLDELHRNVTADALDWLARHQPQVHKQSEFNAHPADVAIIGVGVWLPGATDAQEYWRNLVQGANCLTEVPSERWDWRLYYDPDPATRDRIYSKWGGFITEQPFDPTRYGLPPVALKSVDALQLLTLETVRQALEDAGIDLAQTDRERIAVVLGTSGGMGELGLAYATRADLLRMTGRADEDTLARLPEWTEDSFAGLLPNVAAGRVSNRFDFGGVNCAVDAACASSLAAIYQAVNELRLGHSDLAIAGGADTMQSPFMYLCFSKTQALSPKGRPRTFDEQADGIAIAEGVAAVVLKRLADAERDGDRIYAVIKGVAGSSDGRAKGLTAPRPAGQLRALRRAYQEAGYSPVTVGLWEAHGTGTVAGDRAELETVTTLLDESSASPASGAIGSAKTLIGHTKAAAGAAGLIKAALALHYRVLPPHRGVDRPLPPLRDPASPLFINPEARPWLRERDYPRRASVSAFGFGGANFHATLEEYDEKRAPESSALDWPVELFVWRASDHAGLIAELERLQVALQASAQPRLAELAAALAQALPDQGLTLAIVAGSLAELAQQTASALRQLRGLPLSLTGSEVSVHLPPLKKGGRGGLRTDDGAKIPPNPPLPKGGTEWLRGEQHQAEGIYLPHPWPADGDFPRLAVLFPGQGSQYPDMLRELAVALPQLAAILEQANTVLADVLGQELSACIYPPRRFTPETDQEARRQLTCTNIAQPALGAVEAGLWAWLQTLNLQPEFAAGHSYGEYVALHAADVLDLETLMRVSEARGRFIVEAATGGELGTMLAARADAESVKAALRGVEGITLANYNAPQQLVLSGSTAAIEQARQALSTHGISAAPLPVAAAFHSPIVEPARAQLAEFIAGLPLRSPTFTVYGNFTADPYPQEPAAIRDRLAAHLAEPVNFTGEIEAMYAAGARVFLEVGPRNVLTRLTQQILHGQLHLAVAVDDHGGGLNGLLQALAALLAHGVQLDVAALFAGRIADQSPSPLDQLLERAKPAPLSSHVWWLSGTGVRRQGESYALGVKPPLTASVGALSKISPNPPFSKGGTEQAPSPLVGEGWSGGEVISSTENHVMNDPSSGPPLATGSAPGWAVDQALAGYQETMRQFLRLQEQVMLAYFAASREESGAESAALQPLMPAREILSTPLSKGGEIHLSPPVMPAHEIPPVPPLSKGGEEGITPPASAQSEEKLPDLKNRLLTIASERTGYPPEMLGLDQDIEADLGIDSIKRVEILGLFRRSLPEAVSQKLQPHMEAIATLPTFQQILDAVTARLATETSIKTLEENARPFELTGTDSLPCAPLSRFIVKAHPQSLTVPPSALEPGVYLITSDKLGVADALSGKLRQAGVQPLLIPEELLEDTERLSHWLQTQSRSLTIRAVIHLLPLGQPPLAVDAPLTKWRECMNREVKSLFALLQQVGTELRNGGRLLTVSGLGGEFGRNGLPEAAQSIFPGGAGLTGLVKTLNLEWNPDAAEPGFIGKALDIDPDDDPERLAALAFQELALPGGRREVGYLGGVRTIFRTVPASLSPLPTPRRQPDEDWIVLATGGARGITAETLRELALFRPTLILLGRTPLPDPEDAVIRHLPDAAALRRHLLAQASAEGRTVKPAEVERNVQSLLRDREIRANLADFIAMGARVDYRVVDVRNETEMAALLNTLYQTHGRIDAVIHGAGVIEDGWFLGKSGESMDRVIDAKVDSAFLLAKYLRPETLKFIAFFTSVAGRFGNRGQADYATANEIVARLAWRLRTRWGDAVKVAAIHWSPWDQTTHGAGMVTPEVRQQFEARGVHLVNAAAGRCFLLNELLYGPTDEVELVAGDYPWEYAEMRFSALPGQVDPSLIIETPYALLQGGRLTELNPTSWQFEKTVDLITDPYLDHHRLDGVPVLPFAVAMEYMAEAVAVHRPELPILELEDVRLLQGLRLTQDDLAIKIQVHEQAASVPEPQRCAVTLGAGDQSERPAYRATVVIRKTQPALSRPQELPPNPLQASPATITVEEAYRRWLFHGPLLQTIAAIEAINHQGIDLRLTPSRTEQFCPFTENGAWRFDPGWVDAIFQAVLIWSCTLRGSATLPNRVGLIQCFSSSASIDLVKARIRVHSERDDPVTRGEAWIVDE